MVNISAVVLPSPQAICFKYIRGYLGAALNQKIAKTEIKLRFSEKKKKLERKNKEKELMQTFWDHFCSTFKHLENTFIHSKEQQSIFLLTKT